MFRWRSAASASPSCRNMSRQRGEETRPGRMTLMTTSRLKPPAPSRVARWTSPMPPPPMRCASRYLPRRRRPLTPPVYQPPRVNWFMRKNVYVDRASRRCNTAFMRTTTLLASSLLLAGALGACKSKEGKKTPPPAAEKPAEQPAPAAASTPAPAPTPAPATDVDTRITGDRIGPVHLGSPLASAAFPGARLEKQTEQAEGDEYEVGALVENGKTVLVLTDDQGTITGIRTEDPRFRTEAGVGV